MSGSRPLQVAVDFLNAAADGVPGIQAADFLQRLVGQTAAQGPVVDHPGDRLGQTVHLARLDQKRVRSVGQAIDHADGVGRDDRQPARHRFQDGVGEAFRICRRDEDVAAPVDIRRREVVGVAGHLHTVAKVQFGDARAHGFHIGADAGDDQAQLAAGGRAVGRRRRSAPSRLSGGRRGRGKAGRARLRARRCRGRDAGGSVRCRWRRGR